MSGRKLDVGSKFVEFRHAKAFTAEPGGSLWSIHTRSSSNNKASKSSPPGEVTLPEHLGDLLNELNVLQQASDKAGFCIESLRRRIFTDWCAFQNATHDGKEIDNPIINNPEGAVAAASRLATVEEMEMVVSRLATMAEMTAVASRLATL
ncbi:MAG: hypothetical protein R3B47_07410 [Bacteroidia bacterium]